MTVATMTMMLSTSDSMLCVGQPMSQKPTGVSEASMASDATLHSSLTDMSLISPVGEVPQNSPDVPTKSFAFAASLTSGIAGTVLPSGFTATDSRARCPTWWARSAIFRANAWM